MHFIFRDVNSIRDKVLTSAHIGGYTNHAAALRNVEYAFLSARKNSTKYAILITDGKTTLEEGQEIVYADRLRSESVHIIPIG